MGKSTENKRHLSRKRKNRSQIQKNKHLQKTILSEISGESDDVIEANSARSNFVQQNSKTLISETVIESKEMFHISGNRLIDINFYNAQIASINHDGFGCTFKDLYCIGEQRFGLASKLIIQCKMCGKIEAISTENPNKKQINEITMAASVGIGIGYSQLKELFTTIDIPFMVEGTYIKKFTEVSQTIEDVAWQTIKESGKEEFRLATDAGDVNENGVPIISVIVDGAWSKRSYKTNYNALSGVGCIIGARTKKVLFASVRYCSISSKTRSPMLQKLDESFDCNGS